VTLVAPSPTLEGIRTAPWQHQLDAVAASIDEPGFMFDIAMGGGKSMIDIALAEQDSAQSMLILCPRNVLGVWPKQFREHPEREWATWNGAVAGQRGGNLKDPSVARRAQALYEAKRLAEARKQPFAAAVNLEAAWQGDMGHLLLQPWDTIVVDESHRAKAPGGKFSRFLNKLGRRQHASDGGGRILLQSGTITPHSELDFWAQVRAIDGGKRLGTSYRGFCQYFAKPETVWVGGGNSRTVYNTIREDRIDEFDELIAPLIYRLSEDELDRILGLESPLEEVRTCQLDSETRRIYNELERDLIAEVAGGVVTAANRMVLQTRLAQLSGGFARRVGDEEATYVADPPAKAKLLGEVLEDLPLREPVVVFAHFHADLDAIRKVVEDQGRVYGELSGRRRDGLTDDSTMSPGIDVLGAQIKSGGVGIDLTRARYGIYYSLDFNLADYKQSRRRVRRPGQRRRVTYVHLLAEDTVDQTISDALRERDDVIEAVLNRLQRKGAST